jgi:predicted nucleic acid-binding protein
MKLDDALAGVAHLGLDTAPFIYFVEQHPKYLAVVREVFRRVARGILIGHTSAVSLAEVLVQPLSQGNLALERQYRAVLLGSANLAVVPIGLGAVVAAAGLRARYRLHLLDAFQIAVALEQGCEAFLTNDLGLKRVTDLRILVLDELEL